MFYCSIWVLTIWAYVCAVQILAHLLVVDVMHTFAQLIHTLAVTLAPVYPSPASAIRLLTVLKAMMRWDQNQMRARVTLVEWVRKRESAVVAAVSCVNRCMNLSAICQTVICYSSLSRNNAKAVRFHFFWPVVGSITWRISISYQYLWYSIEFLLAEPVCTYRCYLVHAGRENALFYKNYSYLKIFVLHILYHHEECM